MSYSQYENLLARAYNRVDRCFNTAREARNWLDEQFGCREIDTFSEDSLKKVLKLLSTKHTRKNGYHHE